MTDAHDIDEPTGEEIAVRAKIATKEAYATALEKGLKVTVAQHGTIYTVRKSADGKITRTAGMKLPARTKASMWIKKVEGRRIVSPNGRVVDLKLAK